MVATLHPTAEGTWQTRLRFRLGKQSSAPPFRYRLLKPIFMVGVKN